MQIELQARARINGCDGLVTGIREYCSTGGDTLHGLGLCTAAAPARGIFMLCVHWWIATQPTV